MCAYVIADGERPGIDALCRHVQDSGLAKQKTPERFVFVEDFPRTASGKIRKDRLRAEVAALIESEKAGA